MNKNSYSPQLKNEYLTDLTKFIMKKHLLSTLVSLMFAIVYTHTVAQTNASPTVSLTSPVNNATYIPPAAILLTANAADSDGTISKVEFFNGGTLLAGSTDISAPYEFTWTGVAEGTYIITAKATDNQNVVTTSAPVTITVTSAVNDAPTVTLTAPANNATYAAPASVSLVANAADPDGSIAKVEFFNGTTLLPGSTNLLAPYEFTWTGVPTGTYTITAKATDNRGAVTTSAPVTITVSNIPNAAPTVTLTSPVNNVMYPAPASVSLVANAADPDGTIAKVEFFNGDTLLAGSTNLLAPYEFTWTGVAAGTYTITAKATDNRGAVTTSAPVTITVSNLPNAAPTVTLTSPVNNVMYPAPASVSLVADAADSDGTIAKVEFFNADTLLTGSTNFLSPYEFTWTGVAAGTYTITAKATDNRGAVTTSAPVTITVGSLGNNSPTISLTSPVNNTTYSAPASVSLVANAADSDGTIAKVEFFNGGTLLPGSTNLLAPYEFTWTGVTAGTYTITAKATDNSGAVTTSAPVTITVDSLGNNAPTISLTSPVNNTTYSAPASVSLVADASDSDGTIAKVEFFNGGTLLPGSTNLLAPYEFTWTGVAAGTYTITAKATDNTGAVTTSALVTITVDSLPVTNDPIVGTNPFADQTTIKIPHASNTALTISIKDVSGITVWESTGLQTNQPIYIGSGLPIGIYFVSAYYAGTSKVTRLIKF